MNIKGRVLRLLGNRSHNSVLDMKQVKRILVVRNGRIGDVVCMFPLLRELKKNFPEIEVDVYAGVHSYFLFDYCPFVERVYVKYKKRQIFKTWIDFFKMKFRSYDLIIDAMPLKFELQMSLFLLNAKWMVGLEYAPRYEVMKKELKRYNGQLHQVSAGEHTVEYLTDLIRFLNVQEYSDTMLFFNDKVHLDKADTFLSDFSHVKKIALNVDASSLTRSLYEPQIVEISQALASKNTAIILLSLPNRRHEMQELIKKNNLENVFVSYKTESIYDVAAIVSKVQLVISPDTSIIHIASAYNVATVGIYKNDDIHIAGWGPRSHDHAVIRSQFFEENSLEGFSTQELIDAAKAFLA